MTQTRSDEASASPWRAASLLKHFEEGVAGAALVIVIGTTCWGVVTRYITAQPAAWAAEVAAIAFAWLVFVGAAAGFKYGVHVTIDMLVVLLPEGLRRILMYAADGIVLVFLLAVVVLASEFSVDAWGDPTSVLRLPRTVIYSSVVVGSLCMLVRYAQAARRRWRGLRGGWIDFSSEATAEY